MGYTASHLADGRALASKTTVYTVPSGKRVILQTLVVVNISASPASVYLTANFGSGSRALSPSPLTLAAGYLYERGTSVVLEAGDTLEVQASDANAVDYVFSGVLETV